MTSTVAFIGKSGSGKTTLTKAFLEVLKKSFPTSSILLIDNDLSLELSDSFGIKTKNTIYGIKSGKHEYKTGIPDGMSKQEYIEWALEDIIIEIDENTELLGLDIATHVNVQLQTNDAPGKEKVIKKAERDGLYAALDLGEYWLTDILSEE